MMFNKNIVPGILVKFKKGLGNFGIIGNEHHPEERFYILTEIKIIECHDMLVFYGLTEERFFRRYHWYLEDSIINGTAVIVA